MVGRSASIDNCNIPLSNYKIYGEIAKKILKFFEIQTWLYKFNKQPCTGFILEKLLCRRIYEWTTEKHIFDVFTRNESFVEFIYFRLHRWFSSYDWTYKSICVICESI